jgi:hypothetical protein
MASAADASTDSRRACGLLLVTKAACSVSRGSGTSSVYCASPDTCACAGGGGGGRSSKQVGARGLWQQQGRCAPPHTRGRRCCQQSGTQQTGITRAAPHLHVGTHVAVRPADLPCPRAGVSASASASSRSRRRLRVVELHATHRRPVAATAAAAAPTARARCAQPQGQAQTLSRRDGAQHRSRAGTRSTHEGRSTHASAANRHAPPAPPPLTHTHTRTHKPQPPPVVACGSRCGARGQLCVKLAWVRRLHGQAHLRVCRVVVCCVLSACVSGCGQQIAAGTRSTHWP